LSVPKIPYLAVHEVGGERTLLYRFYDSEGRLLYVGITNDPHARWAAHARKNADSWWSKVCVAHTEWCSTRDDAERAEVAAIKREAPLHNISHSDAPTPQRRLSSKYLHPMAWEHFEERPFTYRELSEELLIPYGTVTAYGRRRVREGAFRRVGERDGRQLFVASPIPS
jgi:predicted GIY-YIG superfamily endonuclease